MSSFAHRLLGAAALDVPTYEEVEADRSATLQAFVVVVTSSIATGVGASRLGPLGPGLSGNLLMWSIGALLGWAAWSLLVMQIGGRLLPEPDTRVDVTELLRTLGFATAPGLLRAFSVFFPTLALPLFALTTAWMIVAMVVAVRQALDYTSTLRAVAVCVIGWLLALAMVVVFGLLATPALS
jgi:hypothetical protein